MIHWETLDKKREILLKKIILQPFLKDFYLAGGTALSLQLGLRKSNDFDFFSPHPFAEDALYDEFVKALGSKPKVISLGDGTCDMDVNGIQVSFFHYRHPLAGPLVEASEFPGLRMASLQDIAAMKFSAIGSRSTKRDFYDLYHILRLEKWSAADLVDILDKKYGKKGWNDSYYVMSPQLFRTRRKRCPCPAASSL
jgi:predicted nucleotidyltransferase component of viral defense system